MSVKDVQDYFLQVAKDYKDMNDALQMMEKMISEEQSQAAFANIDVLKQNVAKMKENYTRISYIIWLLNKPVKKEKAEKYERSEKKKLEAIPERDRLGGVRKENKEVIDKIKSLTDK